MLLGRSVGAGRHLLSHAVRRRVCGHCVGTSAVGGTVLATPSPPLLLSCPRRAYVRPAEFLPEVFTPHKYARLREQRPSILTPAPSQDVERDSISADAAVPEMPKRRGSFGDVLWQVERDVKSCIRAADPLVSLQDGQHTWLKNRMEMRQLVREFAEMDDVDVRGWRNRGRSLILHILDGCGWYNLPREGIRVWERLRGLKWKKDVELVNSFITMLARTKRNPDTQVGKVEADIIKQMNEVAIKPNAVTFGSFYLLSGSKLSEQVAKKQKKLGLRWKRDSAAVNHVLGVLCHTGRITRAWELFREISTREYPLEASDPTWRTMISSCVHLPDVVDPNDRANVALATFQHMEDTGLTPSVQTYHAVAHVLHILGCTDKMLEFHADMERAGVSTSTTVALALQSCAGALRHGDRKALTIAAEELFARSRKVPGQLSDECRTLMRIIRTHDSEPAPDTVELASDEVDYLAPLSPTETVSPPSGKRGVRATRRRSAGDAVPPWEGWWEKTT